MSLSSVQSLFSSVQSLSRVWLFVTPWREARQASLSITNSQSPPKPMTIELVMPSNHLILCCPLLLLPSIFPSIRVFSNESALHIRWPKYWSFSFSISPSNEHPGLVSFRLDWWDLLAVQGNLKSLLQHHSSKTSILWHSAFFIVHLSHSYMTTGKTIALTRDNFVGKVMNLHTHNPTPNKEQACPPSLRSKQGNLFLFLFPDTAAGTPIKPCLNLLSGLWSTSVDWGRPRILVSTNTISSLIFNNFLVQKFHF